jgi:hypothetical protein
MTDEAKALVAWLREEADLAHYRAEEDMLTEAADHIAALAAQLAEARAENARLLASVKGWAADAARLNDNADYWRQECHRLRETLAAYTEYCGICHGRGSFIEEDAVTGADLWRDCPGCTPARAALKENPNEG